MFASGYNQGFKATRDAPSAPLADLRAPEVDFDGEEVHYGEDDNPLPKDPPPLPSIQQEDNPSMPLINNDLVSSAFTSPAASVTNSNGVEKE